MASAKIAKAIDATMRTALAKRNWRPVAICAMREVFARDTLVTPFLWAEPRRRAIETYIIDAAIGIYHQGFERTWWEKNAKSIPLDWGGNDYCAMLHLGNMPRLNRYIRIDSAIQDVEEFCTSISDILEEMPKDESALPTAFELGTLCGTPIETFRTITRGQKFAQFQRFVLDGMVFA